MGNLKPINTYPYYTKPDDFKASIYCRKNQNANSPQIQEHCYSVYHDIYSTDMVKKLIITVISELMVTEVVVEGMKHEAGELVLEDIEIAIIDQVAEPTAYENCLSLCKVVIKNFKAAAVPVLVAMLGEVGGLRQQGEKGNRIIGNLIDIVVFLPQVLDNEELPLGQVQELLSMLYEQKQFKSLSRIVRNYFASFDSKMQRMCLDLLVTIVSSPISSMNSSEVVYQSALALKTVLS